MLLSEILPTLYHSGDWTWDEWLLLILGAVLVLLMLALGRQRSQTDDAGPQTANPAGPQPLDAVLPTFAPHAQPAIEIAATPRSAQPRRRFDTSRPMIAVQGVSQRFGRNWALRGVTVEVPAGACYCIFGPNGAGKTTLLNILATLREPSHGDAFISGISVLADPLAVRRMVGRAAHNSLLYENLSVLENLEFFGRLHHVLNRRQRAEYLLQQLGMWKHRHESIRKLSHGQVRRVSIARAIMHDPPVLLLDEPYSGLDLRAADRLDNLLGDLLDQQHTLFMTSHNFERALERADKLAIMRGGRLLYETDAHTMTRQTLREAYHQVFTAPRPTYA